MNKQRKKIIDGNEISRIYEFDLGGYLQKVLIEGRDREKPVVITLHGGPGTPIPFSVGCRGLFPLFTDNFIMVYWDQLGCGINNYKIDDSFKIKMFVDMTCDLIGEVRKIFPHNKIYLFSVSWGSVLSALALDIMESELSGVVSCGQIIKDIFFNDEVTGVLEKSGIPQKKLDIIKSTTPENATSGELRLVSTCLRKYTDAYNNKRGRSAPVFPIINGLITSPDYTFKDFKAVMINGYAGNNSLWNDLLKIDLTNVLTGVKIPYIILQGDTDIVASTKTAREVVEGSENSSLVFYEVENTGHFPGADMMDKVFEELTKISR